jgi:hypothetical protein
VCADLSAAESFADNPWQAEVLEDNPNGVKVCIVAYSGQDPDDGREDGVCRFPEDDFDFSYRDVSSQPDASVSSDGGSPLPMSGPDASTTDAALPFDAGDASPAGDAASPPEDGGAADAAVDSGI